MIKKFIKPIFLGVIAAGGALVFELLFSSFFPTYDFSAAALSFDIIIFLIIAAAIEEFFKLLVIYKSFFLQKNNGREFLSSALLLGLGFALAEITISNYFGLSENPNLYFGILGIFLVHMLSAGLIGYLLIKIRARIFTALALVFLAATALHFTYNWAIIAGYLQK
ncbi:MAG: PrsW family glutamic-type intramembrane protease [Parcubacteria group bacterium]